VARNLAERGNIPPTAPPPPSDTLIERAATILARQPHRAELPVETVKAFKGEARRIIADEPRPDILAGKSDEIRPTDQARPEVDAIIRPRLSDRQKGCKRGAPGRCRRRMPQRDEHDAAANRST
jgi:hypothetical protein